MANRGLALSEPRAIGSDVADTSRSVQPVLPSGLLGPHDNPVVLLAAANAPVFDTNCTVPGGPGAARPGLHIGSTGWIRCSP